jgi:hypothetical protein
MKITRVRADQLDPKTMLLRSQESALAWAILSVELTEEDVLVTRRDALGVVPLVFWRSDLVIVEMIEPEADVTVWLTAEKAKGNEGDWYDMDHVEVPS